jgi:hypothetical protein
MARAPDLSRLRSWARHALVTGLVCACLGLASPAAAQQHEADVVLVMDTSISLPKQDPDERSVLVARLMADLVAGRFAVVRLRDIKELPTRPIPGPKVPCGSDLPGQECNLVEILPEAITEARQKRPGMLSREQLGMGPFKRRLDAHLAPTATTSLFNFAFEEALGWFESLGPAPAGRPRVVLWLSDGISDDDKATAARLRELHQQHIDVEPLLFGRGAQDTLVKEAKLTPLRVADVSDLIPQFTEAFRKIVGATHRETGRVASHSPIEIKTGVDEAWVIVYGDATLTRGTLTGPGGARPLDSAAETHARAGAYRVLHLVDPAPGSYQLAVEGGGSAAAFALIQTATLTPVRVSPTTASVGQPTELVIELRGRAGQALGRGDLPSGTRLTIEGLGNPVELRGGEDGRFRGPMTFDKPGKAALHLHVRSEVLDRRQPDTLDVTGMFQYRGGVLRVDFGKLGVGDPKCEALAIDAEQAGAVALSLATASDLPDGLALELRAGSATHRMGTPGVPHASGEPLDICLVRDPRVASTRVTGFGARLVPAGFSQAIPLELSWDVTGLTWWERYRAWVFLFLIVAFTAFVVYGYYSPFRWPRGLSLTFAPTIADLNFQRPVPIKTWKGTGIGFYRHARAFLHPDFRVSGSRQGALLSLVANRHGVTIRSLAGAPLFLASGGLSWEPLDVELRPLAPGDTIRMGDRGPFARLHVEGQAS